MPSPRQARLGTLPSLSFSPISATNLLGAMKELNSFATLSLPQMSLSQCTAPTGPSPCLSFSSWEVEGGRLLTFTKLWLQLSASQTKHVAGPLLRKVSSVIRSLPLVWRVRPERNRPSVSETTELNPEAYRNHHHQHLEEMMNC